MKPRFATIIMVIDFLRSEELRIWLRLLQRPLLVAATLCLMLWVGGRLNAKLAYAEAQTTPLCPNGYETVAFASDVGMRCLPPCLAGFEPNLLICAEKCPVGYSNDGALCRKDAQIIAKQSYGRGAGVGLICAINQEAQGGLCYPRCAPGYYGAGPVCWQTCKPGYADHGLTCFKHLFDFYGKPSYGRGAGGPVSACAAGLEQSGTFCYPRCAPGFYGAGPVCYQQCPNDYKDDGALCRKDAHIFPRATYGRGLGELPNHPPFLQNGPLIPMAKDTTVPVPALPATDEDGDVIYDVLVRTPEHGHLDHAPDNPSHILYYYTPDPGFQGVDSFDWQASDLKHRSNTATVTFLVGVQEVNVEPVAIDRTISVTEETQITITVTCTDANNDPLSYRLIDKPQHGDYRWLPPNQIVYTPTVEFVGTDRLTFQAFDGRAFSNSSVVTLTVNAVNDAPLALAQTISTTRNSNAAITLVASDAERDPITYTLVSSPTHGTLSGTGPALLYTPQPNFVGADSFQFSASDPQGAATVATVNITVLPTNTAPLASNLVLTTEQESAMAVNFTASDADGDNLTYTVVSSPTHGTLSGAGADWVYTPQTDFMGVDLVTFKATDGQADSAPAAVTINVVAAPAEASLVGLVFDDSNGNGQPDDNERGVGGLLVTLTPTDDRAATVLTATTDDVGGWRMDGATFGQYTLRILATNGIQIAAPVELTINLRQRGVQQSQPTAVQVTSRALFLPLITR